MKKIFPVLAIMFALASGACASTYYADIMVDVDASGGSALSGISNHPLLSAGRTDSFTSKAGRVWLFNMTLPRQDVFSDYVYAIELPPGAQVNYVKAESFRITSPGGRIRVSGSGRNGPLSVLIQYQIGGEPAKNASFFLVALVAVVLITAGFIFFFLRRKHGAKAGEGKGFSSKTHEGSEVKGTKDTKTAASNYSRYEGVLTERQKDILRIVSGSDKPMNQAFVCEALNLPKSSVSRNVATLADLGMIEKKRIGMSTFLSLKKE